MQEQEEGEITDQEPLQTMAVDGGVGGQAISRELSQIGALLSQMMAGQQLLLETIRLELRRQDPGRGQPQSQGTMASLRGDAFDEESHLEAVDEELAENLPEARVARAARLGVHIQRQEKRGNDSNSVELETGNDEISVNPRVNHYYDRNPENRDQSVGQRGQSAAGATKVHRIKVPTNLPKFKGKDGIRDPEEFINKFGWVCRANYVEEHDRGSILVTCLEDRDAKWLDRCLSGTQYRNGGAGLTWEQLRESFLEHFQNPNPEAEWLHQITALKMEDSVQAYVDEFMPLLAKVGWPEDSSIALHQFKTGLPRWLLNQVTTAESQHILSARIYGAEAASVTVSDLASLAIHVEANNRIHGDKEVKRKDFMKKSTDRPTERPTNGRRCD